MTTSPHGHLYFLEARRGLVRSCRTDGSELRTLVSGYEGRTPDGIQVDLKNGHVYWTCMGKAWSENDGYIERCDIKDGGNIKHIVPPGKTFTPKQIQLDAVNSKLYWCDREGMRVMRCNLDGSSIETLVQTGSSAADRLDPRLHCVGIALDLPRGFIYWTQKGTEPDGNSFNSAPVGEKTFVGTYEILHRGFREAIGVALDLKREKAYVADLAGAIHAMRLDGTHERTIYDAGSDITGIVFADDE
ncbi:hypothetical protein RQP46_010544 [Phenoliferia psychrophenolica]